MNENALISLTSFLPKREIRHERGLYLTRWTLFEKPDAAGFVYIHCFHDDDTEELHSHPWDGDSTIISGTYQEERRQEDGSVYRYVYTAGDTHGIRSSTFHRVSLWTPRVWTLFETGPRKAEWGFWNRNTGVYTPWCEALLKRGLADATI